MKAIRIASVRPVVAEQHQAVDTAPRSSAEPVGAGAALVGWVRSALLLSARTPALPWRAGAPADREPSTAVVVPSPERRAPGALPGLAWGHHFHRPSWVPNLVVVRSASGAAARCRPRSRYRHSPVNSVSGVMLRQVRVRCCPTTSSTNRRGRRLVVERGPGRRHRRRAGAPGQPATDPPRPAATPARPISGRPGARRPAPNRHSRPTPAASPQPTARAFEPAPPHASRWAAACTTTPSPTTSPRPVQTIGTIDRRWPRRRRFRGNRRRRRRVSLCVRPAGPTVACPEQADCRGGVTADSLGGCDRACRWRRRVDGRERRGG